MTNARKSWKPPSWKKFTACAWIAVAIIFSLPSLLPALAAPGLPQGPALRDTAGGAHGSATASGMSREGVFELAGASSEKPGGAARSVAEKTGAGRVVILAPAAADILLRLGAGENVVGVTNSVHEFPLADRVGTHLSPGVEKIASLRPGLIIASSRFNPELAGRMGAELFVYEPKSLDEIIEDVLMLARKLHREEEGRRLAAELQAVLDGLRLPEERPTALYETRSSPLAVAKDGTIIKDLLERAGFSYAYPQSAGAVSAEYLMANQPEFYLYQEGPMNRNPERPVRRAGWRLFGACAWKVDEFEFARPNTELFATVRTLNEILNSPEPCAAGARIYPE